MWRLLMRGIRPAQDSANWSQCEFYIYTTYIGKIRLSNK